MSVERLAWLVATDGGLSVGDPGREHLLLCPGGIEHHAPDPVSGEPRAAETWDWSVVRSVSVRARTTDRTDPGRRALWTAALLEAIGFGHGVGTSDVTVHLDVGGAEPVAVLCDGLPGSAYRREEHVAALDLLTGLVASPDHRPELDRPASLLR